MSKFRTFALVNQKGILLSDYRAQVEVEVSKPYAEATPAERAKVLREMVNEELLVQRAMVLDLPETTNEVRTNLAVGVNGQVAAPVLAYEPTDAELREDLAGGEFPPVARDPSPGRVPANVG